LVVNRLRLFLCPEIVAVVLVLCIRWLASIDYLLVVARPTRPAAITSNTIDIRSIVVPIQLRIVL
jgi:hypothetical protein